MKNDQLDRLIQILAEGEFLTTAQMGSILSMSTEEVEAGMAKLNQDGILLGMRPVFHPDYPSQHEARAVIEVKISPEREGGFDRIAARISQFDRVESCYLMSGSYDLLVVLRASDLKRVASFVFEKLAPIAGVTSTATHFMLKAYKEQGYAITSKEEQPDKPSVSP